MLLVTPLQTSHGYGKIQELSLVAMIVLFWWMYIAAIRGFISAMHGMELAIARSVHVTWMYFVSQLTQKLELMVCQLLTRSLECPLHCATECYLKKHFPTKRFSCSLVVNLA